MDEDFLKEYQAAKYLGIDCRGVKVSIFYNYLPYIKINGTRHMAKQDLIKFGNLKHEIKLDNLEFPDCFFEDGDDRLPLKNLMFKLNLTSKEFNFLTHKKILYTWYDEGIWKTSKKQIQTLRIKVLGYIDRPRVIVKKKIISERGSIFKKPNIAINQLKD